MPAGDVDVIEPTRHKSWGGEQVYESPRMGGSSRLGRRPVASGLLAVSAWRVVTDQRWTVAYQETADPNDKMCFAVLAREG
jgi:hypothetical protein